MNWPVQLISLCSVLFIVLAQETFVGVSLGPSIPLATVPIPRNFSLRDALLPTKRDAFQVRLSPLEQKNEDKSDGSSFGIIAGICIGTALVLTVVVRHYRKKSF